MAELTVAGTRNPIRILEGIPFYETRKPRGPHTLGAFLIGNNKPRPPGELPDFFRLDVKDAALEPMLSKGDMGVFSTEAKPKQGDVILVGTIFGPELRQYEPLEDGHWAACALNPEYEHILTTEEQAWVMAVLVDVQ